ncbi:Uncharacterised protein [Vibrio cholerae]|nr:Uncharacterised protein [Vibrio cholerae]CSB55780.1 Uncharacterised protein [Vibrio cholerae]
MRSYSSEVSPSSISNGFCRARCTPDAVATKPSMPDAPRLENTSRPSSALNISTKRTIRLLPKNRSACVARSVKSSASATSLREEEEKCSCASWRTDCA